MKEHYSRIIKTAVRSFALLSFAFLVSCGFSTQSDPDGRTANRVTVSFAATRDFPANSVFSGSASQSARTVLPSVDPEISRYELWGSKDGGALSKLADITALDTATLDLDAGNWNFTMKAFNWDGAEFLSGSTNGVELVSGSVTVAFTLEPLLVGNGSVDVTVDWSTAGVTVSSVEVLFDGTAVSPVPTISSNKVTFGKSGVPAGTRLLTFYLKNAQGGIACSVSEMVRVYPGMTSAKTIALASTDFNSIPAAPSGFTLTRIPGKNLLYAKVILSWKDESNNEQAFHLYNRFSPATKDTSYAYPGAGTESYALTISRGSQVTFKITALNGYGESEMVATTYSAPALCTVSYSANYVSSPIVMTTATVESGDGVAALPTDPKKEGYRFCGWWTGKNGAGTGFTATTPVTANITVYAKWQLPSGTGGVDITIPQAVTVNLTAPASVTSGDTLTASAACSTSVGTWYWYLDGALVPGQTTASFSYADSARLGKGPHTLMAMVLVDGNAYSDSKTVQVQ